MSQSPVLCFSHLRWNYVYQRPNHLMSRCARERQVLFIEPALFDATDPWLEVTEISPNLLRVVPHQIDDHSPASSQDAITNRLLHELCERLGIAAAIHWFYTPMMWPLAKALPGGLVVYDCMDQLSAFRGAPPELCELERSLMARADVMFTGGMALYEAKREDHHNVHGVPSSVDVPFFETARMSQPDPHDQAAIPHPRVGYAGVIDERIDLALIEAVARARPQLHFVMVGPVVKIDWSTLPRLPNIHYLDTKKYEELPSYMAGWDVAIMPFALNEATRFISPTKTPEYLAAGRRVVSTAIRDVVEPYERLGLVRIGRSAEEFATQLDAALADDGARDAARDEFLLSNSWDRTWARMERLLEKARQRRQMPTRDSETSEGEGVTRGVGVR
jgi:UDP-galactopyranose mutase